MEVINNDYVYGIGFIFILALLYVWNDTKSNSTFTNKSNFTIKMNLDKPIPIASIPISSIVIPSATKNMNIHTNTKDAEFGYKLFPKDPRPQPYQQPVLLIEKSLDLKPQPPRAWGEYPIRKTNSTSNTKYPYMVDKDLENNHFFSDYYKTWWQPKTNGRYGDWNYRNPDWFPSRYVRQPELENRMTDASPMTF